MTTELLFNLSKTAVECVTAPATTPSPTDAATVSGSSCLGAMCGGGIGGMLIIYGILFLLLYLFMIRPQKKKREAEEQMKKNIEIGDEIVTIGGICGRVVSFKDEDALIIETGAEKNKIKIMRWGVLQNNTIKEVAQEEGATKKKGLFGFLKK